MQRRSCAPRNSLRLKQSQVYHLNHIECLPYRGRRSCCYSTHSSSLHGLVTGQGQSSLSGSPLVPLPDSLSSSNPILHRDTSLARSNPVLLRRHQRNPTADPFSRQQSLSDLPHGMSYNDHYRSGMNPAVFRAYLDYQAVRRQSYLLAVSQECLLESDQQQQCPESPHNNSLSTEAFLALPLHLVSFLFSLSQHVVASAHTKRIVLTKSFVDVQLSPFCIYYYTHPCFFHFLPLLPLPTCPPPPSVLSLPVSHRHTPSPVGCRPRLLVSSQCLAVSGAKPE